MNPGKKRDINALRDKTITVAILTNILGEETMKAINDLPRKLRNAGIERVDGRKGPHARFNAYEVVSFLVDDQGLLTKENVELIIERLTAKD